MHIHKAIKTTKKKKFFDFLLLCKMKNILYQRIYYQLLVPKLFWTVIFTMIFTLNSTLDDNHSNIFITTWAVSRLDSKNVITSDKIPLVVLKNINPKLSPILEKLFIVEGV